MYTHDVFGFPYDDEDGKQMVCRIARIPSLEDEECAKLQPFIEMMEMETGNGNGMISRI